DISISGALVTPTASGGVVTRRLGLGHHLLSLASEVCLRPPLAVPREAIILDAQADVCSPALVRVGAPCDHVPAEFRLPLALEGAQSLASPSAISIDDSEQKAAPIERGASSSVGSPYADERHVDGVVGQQFFLARPFIIGHGHVPLRCLDPNVICCRLNQTIRFCSVAGTGLVEPSASAWHWTRLKFFRRPRARQV